MKPDAFRSEQRAGGSAGPAGGHVIPGFERLVL